MEEKFNGPKSDSTKSQDVYVLQQAVSSRQTVLVVEGKTVSSRLLSPREAARLDGCTRALPDSGKLQ